MSEYFFDEMKNLICRQSKVSLCPYLLLRSKERIKLSYLRKMSISLSNK